MKKASKLVQALLSISLVALYALYIVLEHMTHEPTVTYRNANPR